MGLVPTLLLLFLALGLAALANWLERRPRELGRPPLIPWTATET
jgi:hypothetical protein